MRATFDVVVLGGGFFGCEAALALSRSGFDRIAIIEREPALLRRASYVNQARIHNGYHYPRSLATAVSSHANFTRFCQQYSFAVHEGMTMLYAIARDSRVNPSQFERFCRSIGAPFRPQAAKRKQLFDDAAIEEVYEVREVAFDASALARHLAQKLADSSITVLTGKDARVLHSAKTHVTVQIDADTIQSGYVFNCTYAALDKVGIPISAGLKREFTEIALIEPPRELADLGITVIDGPFFSTMPFPMAKCHSLTHVRYTPHEAWVHVGITRMGPTKSNARSMLRDSARYLPCLSKARYLRSLFDVKVVLLAMEQNDGRPILFERSTASPRIVSILGAKLDNIFDIVQLVESHAWH